MEHMTLGTVAEAVNAMHRAADLLSGDAETPYLPTPIDPLDNPGIDDIRDAHRRLDRLVRPEFYNPSDVPFIERLYGVPARKVAGGDGDTYVIG